MALDVRGVESAGALEIYITATPRGHGSISQQAQELFPAVAAVLRRHGAWICQERVFAPPASISTLRSLRAEAYGGLNDTVEPAWLASVGGGDRIAAVQVHAVHAAIKPRPLSIDGVALGRAFEQNGCRWVTASGVSSPQAGDAPAQVRATFEKAEALLKQVGADLRSVARTWIFMDNILAWYGQFNHARNSLFIDRGILVRGDSEGRMPASTGIGISPASSAKCAMDLFAVVGGDGLVKRYHAAGKQKSAYEYGSAFARAAQAKTPAGHAIFVSGTAAIDTAGATCHVGDPAGQVQMTLENVTAVLNQMGTNVRDVVQAVAYCATSEVRELFETCWADTLPWPWVVLIGDVCRDDLLFEVEVTACPGAKKM
jgi:enamine deaminase RidA (YjgF/YER057c/UK114 family)